MSLRHHSVETATHGDGKRSDRYNIRFVPLRELLPYLHAPLAAVRTEFGLVTTSETAAEMRGLVAGHGVGVEIPASGHNPMFEQPLALVGVLRTLLTAWFPVVSRRGEANG